jgi:branched-chain amino acid transport system substrate-binding protein
MQSTQLLAHGTITTNMEDIPMKRSQLASIFLCLLVMMGLVVSACTPAVEEAAPVAEEAAPVAEEAAPEPEVEELEVYEIGLSFPLTGDLASYGDSAAKAALLAQEEINDAGGINGIPIEVVIEDDRCDGEGGLTVLNKMSAGGIPVVTGFFCSSGVLSVCDRYNELNIVQYVIGSNPKIFAEDGCGPYTFGFFGNDNDQGREQARLVLEDLAVTEAGIIYVNNDYGIGVKDAFIEAFEEGGGEVIIELGVQQEGTEFRTEVARLKDAGPEVTIFEMYGSTGSVFLKQAAELGLETQFVGDNNWASIETLMMEPTGAEGIIAPTTDVGTPEYDAFVESFKERWGEEPFFGSDLVYDQIYVAAYAIEESGYTGEGIREATTIVTEDFIGASGPKAMPNGKNVIYNFSWVQFINGELVPFEP